MDVRAILGAADRYMIPASSSDECIRLIGNTMGNYLQEELTRGYLTNRRLLVSVGEHKRGVGPMPAFRRWAYKKISEKMAER